MLVRIRPEDAEIGMFIHAFDGSWFDHPFWRRHFRVETAEQLRRIRLADIDALVIDVDRSLVPVGEAARVSDGAARAVQPPRRARERFAVDAPRPGATVSFGPPQPEERDAPRGRRGYAAECRRARRTIERTREGVADMFAGARLGRAVETPRMTRLSRAIAASIARDAKALINLVRLKEKDEYTYLHSVAVCALMTNFARHLGLEEDEVDDLGIAGLLHDVGKVAIADAVLNKPGRLSQAEMRSVRSHPVAGHALLATSPGVPDAALDLCLRHHEKVDGSGYPGRLAGEALSLAARMGAICDVYDAVTSNRPYKEAWSPCEALTAMQGWAGHFDPVLLDRFADSLGIFPVGTLVRLSTGELGLVAGSAGEGGEDVVVRAFFDCATLSEIAPVDRVIAPSAEHPRITGRDSPTFWRFPDWEAMRMRVLTEPVVEPDAD
ncbi:MAG: HD-GYP domain-containing protein [Sphingopyxis sp.]